jgi:hypothetical protein
MIEFYLKFVALPVVVVLAIFALNEYGKRLRIKKGELKHCPSCREVIDGKATACKHCGRDV